MFPARIWREMPQRYRLEAAECKGCGKRYYPPRQVCPECGGRVQRLLGAGAAVIFKGSGFHATDYGRSAGGARCGRSQPCCGRDVPCDTRPCDE